ncbi:unnamed protein product [Caenorhabditis auriculariae]|uniref:Uncharacterized protein n=1 Tax=Caenorhabditis auriculariae TaxID=2777116 RepID=A0A8S1H7V3_9PELO|nr:unnamed protein product [Caenorhabditis auriculariae]
MLESEEIFIRFIHGQLCIILVSLTVFFILLAYFGTAFLIKLAKQRYAKYVEQRLKANEGVIVEKYD